MCVCLKKGLQSVRFLLRINGKFAQVPYKAIAPCDIGWFQHALNLYGLGDHRELPNVAVIEKALND